jgi:hypothetical protein
MANSDWSEAKRRTVFAAIFLVPAVRYFHKNSHSILRVVRTAKASHRDDLDLQ